MNMFLFEFLNTSIIAAVAGTIFYKKILPVFKDRSKSEQAYMTSLQYEQDCLQQRLHQIHQDQQEQKIQADLLAQKIAVWKQACHRVYDEQKKQSTSMQQVIQQRHDVQDQWRMHYTAYKQVRDLVLPRLEKDLERTSDDERYVCAYLQDALYELERDMNDLRS